MKRIVVVALSLIATLPLWAASSNLDFTGLRRSTPADVPSMGSTYVDLYKQLISTQPAQMSIPSRITPKVVLEGSEYGFVFPVAGTGAGAGGTFFSTEAVVVNRRTTAQNVAFLFFPIGGGAANCNRPFVVKRLDPSSWTLYIDLVKDVFNTSGFGAVIAVGVDAGNNVDTTARIDGNARIWTPQPGTTNGTTSQNFPSVSLSMPPGGQSVFGVRLDEFYRCNWGVFNYDTTRRTFDITVDGFRGSTQFSRDIDACSLIQQAIPGGPYGSFLMTIGARDGRALYFSYGSSVDNVTGDAWSVTGRSN